MASKLWLIDLDDTLTPNLHDYTRPVLLFLEKVMLTFPWLSISFVISLYARIDVENVENIDIDTGKAFKFTARRFPTSLVQTWQILNELNITNEEKDKKKP